MQQNKNLLRSDRFYIDKQECGGQSFHSLVQSLDQSDDKNDNK